MKWRKLNNILHRDLGYFFAALIIIYSLSGIALNHLDDWNPNYVVKRYEKDFVNNKSDIDQAESEVILEKLGFEDQYKSHFRLSETETKIFFDDGSLVLNSSTNKALIETVKRRTIFYESNYLHYNPNRLWTWVSDIFAGCLIIITITGMLVLRGKKGITGRGKWFIAAGTALPLIFLLFYL